MIYSVFMLLCAVAPDVNTLMIFRFITAFGLGGEVAVGYSLIAEYFPPAKRGKWGVGLAFLINLGAPLAFLLGMLILPLYAMS